MIETEPRPPVRAIVASFLFTDLVDFSKGAASEQYVAKAALAACLRSNLAPLREADYWIKDTGDGALIAFVSNPEHALYMALAIAQDYAQAADGSDVPSHLLRTGLHLGTVKETVDVEARRNYIGDGINATKRIMDFAAPGQIAASRSFFEAVANLDDEYAALFRHLGASDDKHGRAHELYAVAPSPELLRKLRLDLTAASPRPAPPAPQVAPASKAKRDAPLAPPAEITMPPSREARTAPKTLIPIVVLAGVAILAAAMFWITRGPSDPARPSMRVKSRSNAVPTSVKKSDAAPATADEPAARTAASPAVAPRSEETKTVGVVRATKDSVTSSMAPSAVAPPIAPAMTVDSAPKSSVVPAQPSRAPAAIDRAGTRCSRIMEKATLGEPLSDEEKKELANSCR